MGELKETEGNSAVPPGGAGGPGPSVVPGPRDSAAAAAREAADPRIKRWTRLLTRAENDPFSVLRDKRCLRPHFVDGLRLYPASASPNASRSTPISSSTRGAQTSA